MIVDESKCGHECKSDCDCTGESKCCRSACGGHICSEPGKCEIKKAINPCLPEPFFVTCLLKGGGYHPLRRFLL